ncbi:MAG: N-acetylglucosamine-6-phosphate deacetylase [Selenomonadaceae bacterium]|nr:N-acetylglucosamine-6-phosphate deacetylase [Selenomonadaceae bacterium]
MKAIINAKIIAPDLTGKFTVKENGCILFDDKIQDISFGKPLQSHSEMEGFQIIDAKNRFVSPGFINIHMHGVLGADTMDETDDALSVMAKGEASMGVTGFLPTTMTYDIPRIHRALERVRKAANEKIGAKVLGAHMEGPFISMEKRGAQGADFIKRADFHDIEEFTDVIKIITLAVEETDEEFFTKARENGILLSLGHSAADYETAKNAITEGKVQHITHLYNGMAPFHHRTPGIVGAAFDSNVKVELIADNVHSHPMAQRLAYNVKGIENIILITDSMRASCMGDGLSELGGQEVTVKGNLATLKNGAIAGSVVKMNKEIKIFADNTGAPIERVVETVTKNPALSLGIYDKTGSIEVGKRADLTVFDEELEIFATVVEGEIVFNGELAM